LRKLIEIEKFPPFLTNQLKIIFFIKNPDQFNSVLIIKLQNFNLILIKFLIEDFNLILK